MKPCPLCIAAVPDDVSFSPGDVFCGACGRNAAQVRQSPTLPPGATAFAPPAQPFQPPQNPWPQSPSPQNGPQPQTPWPPQSGFQQGGPQQGWSPPGNQQGVWPPPPTGQPFQQGMGTLSQAPPGLNWGGFLLSFIWGPANKVNIGLLGLVGLIPIGITQLISLGVSFYLLFKGNELAWRSGRPWQSVQEFQAVQKTWGMWGLITAVVFILLAIVSSFFYTVAAGGGTPYGVRTY